MPTSTKWGIDSRTRGRRTDEALGCLRRLMTGEPVDFAGGRFRLHAVRIVPAIEPPVPILVGGRSEAALRRTARYGDGWFGIFCIVDRFAHAVERIAVEADIVGRQVDWHHGMQVWCCR